MKIMYDKVVGDYLYPLSKKDVRGIKNILPSGIIEKIKSIKFGCNLKTTQEGRLVKRGERYEIRINFCLNQLRSLILSDNKAYQNQVKQFGGVFDLNNNFIMWKLDDAKRYAIFLLMHEIGHINYCEKFLNGKMGIKGDKKEELYCDKFAIDTLKKISF